MINHDNAITGLQIINTWASYAIEHKSSEFIEPVHWKSIVDYTEYAIELLKERKPVKPVISEPQQGKDGRMRNRKAWCGACGSRINLDAKYCDQCGKGVNWDL